MNALTLGLALTTGLLEVTDDRVNEAVLRGCVERMVPERLWIKEVVAEARRQQRPAGCRRLDYLCEEYYRTIVVWHLRTHLVELWSADEQLWLVTRGKCGTKPTLNQEIDLLNLAADHYGRIAGLIRETKNKP